MVITSALLAGEQLHTEQFYEGLLETPELEIAEQEQTPKSYSFRAFGQKPSLAEELRFRRSDQADSPEWVTDEELASALHGFHATETTESAICLRSFETAMNRLGDYPTIRIELLSRAFSEHFMEGWRPVNEHEREVLTGWLEQLHNRRLTATVVAAQEQVGVQYTDYEYRGKIKRLAELTGSLLSQERVWRNHLRRQSREPAQPSASIFPKIAHT